MSSENRASWNRLDHRDLDASFPAYIRHCRSFADEALQWADRIPQDRRRDLIGGITIRETELRQLPPMPLWMQAIFGPPDPIVFSGGTERCYQWPFSWLAYHSGKHIPADEVLRSWRTTEDRWAAAADNNNWLQANDPAPDLLAPAVARLIESATGSRPTKKWQASARHLVLADGVVDSLYEWLDQLGDPRRIAEVSTLWPSLGTYWSLLLEYSDTFSDPGPTPLSAIERAWMNTSENASGGLPPGGRRSPTLGGPVDGPEADVRARALRQFTYWGTKPFVSIEGDLRDSMAIWPSDTRLLSAENENRMVGVLWMLEQAPRTERLISVATRAAANLGLRVYSAQGFSARERSWRGTKAALSTLATHEAWNALETVEAMLRDPRLKRFAKMSRTEDAQR